MIKFGTGGFRGVIGDEFTKENVRTVAQALCNIMLADGCPKKIVIGYDHRFGSDYFAGWMAETFAANGIEVGLYSEPMPTPAVMTAVRDCGLSYGVMITASHNPYNFNGVKVFVKEGRDADVAFTNRLEEASLAVTNIKYMPLDQAVERGIVAPYSNMREYLDNIKKFLNAGADFGSANILYDNLNGVGARCIEPLFKELGVKNYTILHAVRDAFFNRMPPNPTEQAMRPLKELVLSEGYSFAMATDSDGDRLGILDEKGNYVSSNEILACLYYYLVKYRKMEGDVVKNCATSVLLDKLANRLGYACREVDVGFKNISAGITKYNALLGGESSGGLTVRGYIFGKDSVFSSMLFTEMTVAMGKPVSQIVREVREFAGYDYVCVEDQISFDSAEGIMEYVLSHEPAFDRPVLECKRLNNNIKYLFEGGCWALLRLSGTEPVFRVFVECESRQAAEYNVKKLRELINLRK